MGASRLINSVLCSLILVHVSATNIVASWTADMSQYEFLLDPMLKQVSRDGVFTAIFGDSSANPQLNVVVNNIMLGVYGTQCKGVLEENVSFRTANRRFGVESLIVLTTHADNVPDIIEMINPVPSSCAYILYVGAGDTFAKSINFIPSELPGRKLTNEDVSRWTFELSRAELAIWNKYHRTVRVNWIDEGKEERVISTLEPNMAGNQNTYMGHVFTVRDDVDNKLLAYYIVGRKTTRVEVSDTSEYPTEDDFFQVAFKHWYDSRRVKNWFQPNIVPAITPVGFHKSRAPESLFADVLKFYRTNEPRQQLESLVGPCVNQEVAPTYMIDLSQSLRSRIYNEFQHILEDWSGLKLQATSLYGIRKYTNNSVLKMHVDTIDTHVISAIVNVAQDVETDWELEILDHTGVLHKVIMEPGDMVLYESAKALHGRPKPLRGNLYSNFFLHYAPTPGSMEWDYRWY